MAGNLAKVEKYLSNPVDVDSIGSGRYAVLGRYMDSRYRSGTGLEAGSATSRGYEPEFQVRFPTGRRDSPAGSYLDKNGFSGCAYILNRPQFSRIRALVEDDGL